VSLQITQSLDALTIDQPFQLGPTLAHTTVRLHPIHDPWMLTRLVIESGGEEKRAVLSPGTLWELREAIDLVLESHDEKANLTNAAERGAL